MGAGSFIIGIILMVVTIKLFLSADFENDYIGKCWFFILAVIFFFISLYFVNLSYEGGMNFDKAPSYNNSYYYNNNY